MDCVQTLPGESGGHAIENALGKLLNLLGDYSGGLLPSDANAGGLLAQIPIMLGADDAKHLIVQIHRQDAAAVQADPDGYLPISELPGYAALEPQSQAQLQGLMISKHSVLIDAHNATYQNHTNGILNTLPEALVNAHQQTGATSLTINYNPTHGLIPDLLESAVDKLFGNGVLQTGIAEQTGVFHQTVINARSKENVSANFVCHSQGCLLTNAGLNTLNKEDFSRMSDEQKKQMTFFSNGSPVETKTMESTVNENLQFKFSGSNSNEGDPVSGFLGRNTGQYIPERGIGTAEPIGLAESVTIGIIGLPSFFYDKYPEYDANGNQTNRVSPHSTYECIINCGNEPPVKEE